MFTTLRVTLRRNRALRPLAASLAALLALAYLLTSLVPRALAAPSLAASPTVTLGTYYGGSNEDDVFDMTVDASGIYLTGRTYSSNLPGTSGQLKGSTDMFVAKLNPAGTQLLWGFYIGGSKHDQGNAITSDGKGSIYVTGSTDSPDFPVTPGADQETFGGFTDIVTLRLDAASGAVRWATYLGGDNLDEGNGIALDDQGGVYIAGWWAQGDALVAKYEAATGRGEWGRAFGGYGEEKANALALDAQGNIWVTGKTDAIGTENDFVIAGPALQTKCGSGDVYGSCGADGFVTKLSPNGQEVLYSSFLGGDYNGSETGSGGDEGAAIAIDTQGYVYVAGKTFATNFPTKNPLQISKRGAENFTDGFLTKISPDGSALMYSTYLGGEKWDEVRAIVIDAQGNASVTGFTGSQDFPLKDSLQDTLGNGVCDVGGYERWCYDAFVTQVNPAGALRSSTYLGGALDDMGYALAHGGDGAIYLAGASKSQADQGFPITPGVFQPHKAFSSDGFVVRIGESTAGNPAQRYRIYLPLMVR
jgi:hypothetical protein